MAVRIDGSEIDTVRGELVVTKSNPHGLSKADIDLRGDASVVMKLQQSKTVDFELLLNDGGKIDVTSAFVTRARFGSPDATARLAVNGWELKGNRPAAPVQKRINS